MQIVWLVNWNSNNADFQFQTAPTSFINQGVISGLAVTLNQVAVGSALISVTSNGQTWLITFHNTSLVTIDTSGTKKVWIEVTQAKIDNGVSNNEDGTGIAFINTGASYPWSGSYIPLASIASGVITDDRVFISMKAIKRKAMTANRLLYIDASGNEQELPYGTSGQVLTAAWVSTTPIWASPSVDIHGQTIKNAPLWADEGLVADSEAWFILKRALLWTMFVWQYWNGSDWDITISWTVTMTADKMYKNVTLSDGCILKTNWFKLYISWTLTRGWTWYIDVSGWAGWDWQGNLNPQVDGTTWWTAWVVAYTTWTLPAPVAPAAWDWSKAGWPWTINWTNQTKCLIKAGWASWASSWVSYYTVGSTSYPSATAWVGWTYTATDNPMYTLNDLNNLLSISSSTVVLSSLSASAAWWACSANDYTGCGWGGGGGANGWMMWVSVKYLNISWASAVFRAKWGKWGNGWDGGWNGSTYFGGGGWGGGGWHGWVIVIIYWDSNVTVSWFVDVTAWVGWTGWTKITGNPNNTNGSNGTNWTNGTSIIYKIN